MSAHVTNEEYDRNELFYESVDQDDESRAPDCTYIAAHGGAKLELRRNVVCSPQFDVAH